tara:strand:+ start:24050 stop:24517 length:468 start_codon:yes stop_codon:yes gene_type:complete
MAELIAPRLMNLRKMAMKNKDAVAKTTLSSIGAAFKQRCVDEKLESLTEDQEMAILVKMVKQRKDSIEQFQKAGREDLAEQEAAEIKYIEDEFMPKALTEDEVAELIEAALKESGATQMNEMGKVMAILKPQLAGRADMGKASGVVRKTLQEMSQ